jgi:outer membrane assembly lipoprotein YfiO
MLKKLIVCLVVALSLFCGPAYAYWIWTPKSGKWINPKSQPKPTPKEQLDYALEFYQAKKYEEAIRELRRTLKHYPKSAESAEAQYYLGRTEEERENLYEAFKAYQRVIDKYPFSTRIQEIIEREYNIGETFVSGYKRKALGLDLPVENPAVEIFAKVVDNSNFGPYAAKAQYKLGLVLKSLLRYYEAEDAFNKVISAYPDSEWAIAARFQVASCRASLSRGSDYDQGAMDEAKQQFEDFVLEHPDAVLSGEAEQKIQQLNLKEAEANYNIAFFYEKQHAYPAAKIYYEELINNYPDTPWAIKAFERLQVMERKR